MTIQILYILTFIFDSVIGITDDQFSSMLDMNGFRVINSESVNRNIFDQNLNGKKYTIEFSDSIQIACYDVSRAEYLECNSTIDITYFDISSNPVINQISVEELYNDYIKQQQNKKIPDDEIEFIVEHAPEGLKKINVGLLSLKEDEILLLTKHELMSLKLNSESKCKIVTVLHYFYEQELNKLLGLQRSDLDWFKI